jgi:hypothetical protein
MHHAACTSHAHTALSSVQCAFGYLQGSLCNPITPPAHGLCACAAASCKTHTYDQARQPVPAQCTAGCLDQQLLAVYRADAKLCSEQLILDAPCHASPTSHHLITQVCPAETHTDKYLAACATRQSGADRPNGQPHRPACPHMPAPQRQVPSGGNLPQSYPPATSC